MSFKPAPAVFMSSVETTFEKWRNKNKDRLPVIGSLGAYGEQGQVR